MRQDFVGGEILAFESGDGVRLAGRLLPASRPGARGRLVVVCPGFAQHKDTGPMRRVSAMLRPFGDVLCLDFRGTGASRGRYGFGNREPLDLRAALDWARPRYRERVVAGFSMGSYIALRAAAQWPGLANRLLLVSCPTRLEDVLMTLGPLRQSLTMFTHWPALGLRLKGGSNPFFRWANPLARKPRGEDLAARLREPASFLVGGRDQLVLPSLSRRVFEAAGASSTFDQVAQGYHAEYIFLQHPQASLAWVERELEARGQG